MTNSNKSNTIHKRNKINQTIANTNQSKSVKDKLTQTNINAHKSTTNSQIKLKQKNNISLNFPHKSQLIN